MSETQANTSPASAAGAPPQRLRDLLLTSKLVTDAQIAECEQECAKTGEFLCKILVQKEYTTQDAINACFVKMCKIPHISLLDYDVGTDVLQLIPQEMCLKYGLLPIDKLGRILTVAMVDPLDPEALETIRNHCSELRLKPILCNWAHFEQAARKYFASSKDKNGDASESMASFGLSKLPPAPAPKPAATPAPPRPAAATATAPAATAPAATGGATVDTAALVGAIQEGLRGVIGELASRPAPAARDSAPVAAPAIDTTALVGAIQEGLRAVAAEMATRPSAPETAAAPAFPAEALGEVMRASIRDAMAEAMGSLEQRVPATPVPAETTPAPVPVLPDLSGLETAFRSAMEDLKETLRQPAPAPAPVAPEAPAPSSGASDAAIQELVQTLRSQPAASEMMGEIIRDSVGGAMQEALASVVVQLRANQKPDKEPPSMEAMAETIRDTIGGVMQEAMAAMVVQARGNAGQSEAAAAQQEAMIAAIRDVVESARQSQENQGAKLAALAEAAVQSTQQTSQLVEASLVQNERINNLRQSNRARHASVSAFGTAPAEGTEDPEQATEDARVRDALDAEIPLESLTFDTFFPGKANAFTAQVSQSVAQSPGGEYNPFFLYGNVGLGKTHLISAVGNHIRKANPKHRVGYVSASHFSRRLKEALAADAQDAFRENYCHWDVLILDDIQFMGGRVEAQEEFFHIFNVLHQQGRQIIIASDKAPDRLGLMEQRLVSRFSSGIVVEIKPPEWETRMKILKHHIAAARATIPEEICSLIAMRVTNDIRKMVGSLRKVIAFSALSTEPVTVEMATEILNHLGGEEAA